MNGSYTYVGTYQVTVPAGTYSAILMRMKIDGKVGPAHTEDTAYYFFAPQGGMVAMISQEDVEAFWVIHIDTTIGKVLSAH
jgi:mannose-6-phosphate isomerase-like protein (cupin superfamily)